MNRLESRKQILIAESELNRALLVREWETIEEEVRTLAYQARTVQSVATAAASLVAGLATLRRGKPVVTENKPSWLRTIFKGVGLVSTFWQTLRSK